MKLFAKLSALFLFALLSIGCSNDDDTNTTTEPIILTVTDADGNTYNTITIGNQTWMLENLKTTKYNDGTPISLYNFGDDWGSLNDPKGYYQWADTSDLNNIVDEELPFDVYGAMYNHFAIESGKLAPEGWRIPTQADFMALENFLASEGHAGDEATVLKTETGWLPNSENGTNLYGFNALPNGYVNAFGGPTLGQGICTWATTNIDNGTGSSQTRIMIGLFNNGSFNYDSNSILIGAGIRCIKE